MTRPQQQPPQRPNDHFQPSPPRAAPYSSSPPRAPPLPTRPASVAPPPNLEQLVEMNTESIGSLSISALKSILFTNHVTTGQILEKGDLVQKVLVLVENEKAERVRQRQMEEREEMERLQRAMETMHGTEEGTEGWSSRDRDQQANESEMHSDIPVNNSDRGNEDHPHSSSTPAASPPQSKPPGPIFDRPGMCVICQDEDANIAIIDCGYVIYLFIPLSYLMFIFSFHPKVIWRCVEDVPSWLWKAQKSALCVAHVLLRRLDCFAFTGRRIWQVGIILKRLVYTQLRMSLY